MKQWLSTWTKQSGVLLLLFSTLLFMCAPAYAERVDLLNSAGATAQGAGTVGKAALTGFNIPAGKRRALFIYAAFERDHCDKSTDVCTTSNTGTTGDLSDNFARETGSSTSSNLQITAAVTKGTTTIAKKNALVVGGAPSGSLGYNYAQLKLTPNNTVYFSIESYAIVLNEAEIQTLLGGATSGTVDISFPSIGLPKSTGDEMIVTAYVYNNVEQTVTGIHRVTSNMNTTARTSSMAGNSTITTSTFNTSDMPLGTNDRMLTIGISSMGGPTLNNAPVITSNGGGVTAAISIMENQTAVTTVKATDGDADPLTYSITGGADAATVVQVITSLPPELSTQVCPANVNDLKIDDYRIAWTYNNPVNTLEPSFDPVPNGKYDETTFSSASTQVIGSGLTYNFDNNAQAIIRLAQVDRKSTATALAFGDYIEYSFTTQANVRKGQLINGLGFQIHNLGGSYKISVLVSKDNFATAKVLLNDYALAPLAASTWYKIATTTAMYIEPSTSYQLRIVFHSASDANAVFWDDLHLSLGLCRDFGDAPATYGDATHDIVANATYYLGNAIPDAEGASLGSIDAQGDDTSGLRPDDEEAVTIPSTITSRSTNLVVKVKGAGGLLQAWLDWDKNGTFDTTDQIAKNLKDTDGDGLITVPLNVTKANSNLDSYARFRWNNWPDVDATTPVTDGEVEDYVVKIAIINSPPVITSNGGGDAATISLVESTSTTATTVTATDVDSDTLSYSITGGTDATLFTINTATGLLQLKSLPDYENPTDSNKDNAYVVQVQASDGNGGTDTQLITVNVTNVNEVPVITSNGGGATAAVSVVENQTAVSTVIATDPDKDTLSYSIIAGADATKFTINGTSGVLQFKTAPDYEAPSDANNDNNYVVQVQASDGKGGFDSQTLTITVTDINDAPIITSNGGGDSAAVSVAENQTAVTTVTATDVDKDTLSFSISGGADATLFTLNSVTGVLKFTTAPNFEIPTDSDGNNVYQVEVMVSDSKGGTDKQLLAVTVTNILETAAVRVRVFLQGSYDADMMLMRDDLRRANLIPLTQPYTIAPFKYQGTEQTTSTRLTTGGVAAVVDWVLIELRSTAQRSTVLARKAALLTRSGDVLDPLTDQTLLTFNDADNVNYYVAVLHRNHLGVMTTNALNLAASNNVLVDFSLTSTAVYGGANARLASGAVNVLWAGDTNRSQLVIANGPDNDVVPILNAALIHPANTLLNSNYLVYGYSSNDLDMNGYTLFAGPGNDLNMMVGNVLMHKDNRTSSANFVITGGLLAK